MDRSLLEGDPYVLLEGLTIGGYAIGASIGYIYIRAEYPLAIERLTHAIGKLRDVGLLGEHLFNTDFHLMSKSGLAQAPLSVAKKPH